MRALDLCVVGSGPAGLAVALYLERDGHRVHILERFDEPRPIGAGLLLQPTGLSCLRALGLEETIVAKGARIHRLYGKDVGGKVIFDLDYRSLTPQSFGLGIHRGTLFSALYNSVSESQIPIETDAEISDLETTGGKRFVVDTKGRRHGPFDLVIDASGMGSQLRSKYAAIKLDRPYPYGALWTVLKDEGGQFSRDYLQQRYDGARHMVGMLATGERPLDAEPSVTFFWSLRLNTYPDWQARGLDAWKSEVISRWSDLGPFMEQITEAGDLTLAGYGDTILRRPYSDGLVFIGDAAHATSPQLGQGANLGLLDAQALAKALSLETSLEGALEAYARTRRSHVRFYQYASRWLTPFFQSESGAAGWIRNQSFGLLCKTPIIRTQMLKTLVGIKTGPFSELNIDTADLSLTD